MIKTGKELAEAALKIAKDYKTIYVMGCFGSPMTSMNKDRYIREQPYNRKTDRKAAIMGVSSDTFGFDCVGLIKGLLWDWNGKENSAYGGAEYAINGVPDINANQMLNVCPGNTRDFSSLCVGEVLGMTDHIGIYIGDGLCVESTPRWADGVQITAVLNIGTKSGYNGREWTRHGKLPYLTYEDAEPVKPVSPEGYTRYQFIKDVQSATGSVVDGIAGPETIGNTPTLSRKINASHKAVVPVQKYLAELGYYEDKVDGHFGHNTEKAVIAYQRNKQLRWVDGILTAENLTWRNLLGMED